MMQALRVHDYEPGSAPRLDSLPVPEPAGGEVRVRVHAAGISFVDLLLASGGYQVRPDTPFIPGSEFSGIVDAIGPDDTSGLRPGDRVCGTRQGAWAEFVCLPSQFVQRLPVDASLVEASVLMAPYATALYALRERARLAAGETLFVLGAAGSVGYAAIQLGKVLGARVVAAASTKEKRVAIAAAGADAVIDSTGDWKDAVKAAGGGRGIDVVFDTVGGEATDTAFRTLGWGGRHLMIGFAGGQIGVLKTNLAIVKGAALIGVDLRQAVQREPATVDAVKREVIELYAQGRIRPLIHGCVGFGRFAEGAALVRDRSTLGRVVLDFAKPDAAG